MNTKENEETRNLWIREEIDKMIAALMDREEREGYQSDQCREISKELEHLFIMKEIPLDELTDEPWIQEHFLKQECEREL